MMLHMAMNKLIVAQHRVNFYQGAKLSQWDWLLMKMKHDHFWFYCPGYGTYQNGTKLGITL